MYNTVKKLINLDFSQLNRDESENILRGIMSSIINEFNLRGYNIPQMENFKIEYDDGSGSFSFENSTFCFNESILDNPLMCLTHIFHELKHLVQHYDPNFKEQTEYQNHFDNLGVRLFKNYCTPEEKEMIKTDILNPINRRGLAEKYETYNRIFKHFFKYYYFQPNEVDARKFEEDMIKAFLSEVRKDNELTRDEKEKWEIVLNNQNKSEKDVLVEEFCTEFDNDEREILVKQTKELVSKFFQENPDFFTSKKDKTSMFLYFSYPEFGFLLESAVFLYDDKELIQKIYDGFLELKNFGSRGYFLAKIYKLTANDALTKEQEKELEKLAGDLFKKFKDAKLSNNKYLESLLNGSYLSQEKNETLTIL